MSVKVHSQRPFPAPESLRAPNLFYSIFPPWPDILTRNQPQLSNSRMLSILHSLCPAFSKNLSNRTPHPTMPYIISLIANLQGLIKQQYPAIQTLLRFANDHPFITSRLKRIQTQHSDIHKLLTKTIEATRKMRSRDPWLNEFLDVELSIRRKIRQCNRASHPHLQAMGWKHAAKIYWPIIAESYKTIQKLLDRLELLLGGTEPKGAQRKEEVGTVKFSKEVKGRWILEEGSASKEFTLPLTNDRKRSAKRMRARKNVLGGVVVERGISEQDTWRQVAQECGDLRND